MTKALIVLVLALLGLVAVLVRAETHLTWERTEHGKTRIRLAEAERTVDALRDAVRGGDEASLHGGRLEIKSHVSGARWTLSLIDGQIHRELYLPTR